MNNYEHEVLSRQCEDSEPETCPHGEVADCDKCHEEFQEMVRKYSRKNKDRSAA